MILKRPNSNLVATSSDTVIVYDPLSETGKTVQVPSPNLPPNLTKGQLETLNKEDRSIISLAISHDNKKIAIATENKQVVVFDNSLNLQQNFTTNRTASKVLFSSSGDVIVADRTGDVFLYKLDSENNEPLLLLGHLSIILDVVFSECGKYIITCDRDEKIRVSHYPNTYNIVSYCLGHEEFVSKIECVRNVLVSASGDGTVRIWNYLNGDQLSFINTNQHVVESQLKLKIFSEEMGKEKVDVTALPITNMQTYCMDNNLFIAISTYLCNTIQLYNINLTTYQAKHVKNIDSFEISHCFHLTSNLYILDEFRFSMFTLNGDDYLETTSLEFEKFYNKFKHLFKFSDSNFITVLYKRKFDNVQEYLERKKRRLESHQ